MKKRIVSIILVLLSLCFLAACGAGKLPDNINEEEIKTKAEAIVSSLNQRDYDGVLAQFAEESQDGITAESLSAQLAPILDNLGDFEEVISTSAANQKNKDGTETPVVVVKCKYANGNLGYAVYFNDDSEIVGLFTTGG